MSFEFTMDSSVLPMEIIVELFPHLKLRHVPLLGRVCVSVHQEMDRHLSTRLECLTIDLELINKFIGSNLTSITLSLEQLRGVQEKSKRICYRNLYCCYIDIVFEHICNLYLANNQLEMRRTIRNDSGCYDYYGVDGSFSSVAYLYTATKFSSFATFKEMLKKFRDSSSENAYTDLIYVEQKDIPDDIFNILTEERDKKDRKHNIMNKLILRNVNLPLAGEDGDLVDVDRLLSISNLNTDRKIGEFLSQFRGYTLWSLWWCNDGDEYERGLDGDAVSKIIGDEEGCLIAIPTKDFYCEGEYKRPDWVDTLKRLVKSHAIITEGDINIYVL